MSHNEFMALHEQKLRTRVLHLEYAIGRFLKDGDVGRLRNAYSNEWVRPIGEPHE
ncbi:MAG TPA: hypothetical protein VIG24_19550 [Acidimicrobiia bacterium]